MTKLVHDFLQLWADTTPQKIAIDCAGVQLSFQQLHDIVCKQAALHRTAPEMLLVDSAQNTLQQLIDFLGIVQSGRCAAVSDPDWPENVHQAVAKILPSNPIHAVVVRDTDSFYVGFTSGSTGIPKGFQRNHRSWVESFRVCIDTFSMDSDMSILAPGRISHSLFLFGMLLGLYTGAGIAIQNKFSTSQTLATLQSGRYQCLVAVPSQLLMVMQWAQHRKIKAIETVRLILISGARWMRQHTQALQNLFPNARIVEFYGASETSFVAWKEAHETASPNAVGRPFSNVELQIRPIDSSETASKQAIRDGLIYVRSPMLFMNYVGANNEPTAAVWDGDWLSVGDIGHIDAQGQLCLSGRLNRMIVTQGKNLFPEELENLLASQPLIRNASVHGLFDAVRGAQVIAVLHPSEACTTDTFPNARTLAQWCQSQLDTFKTPRQFFICADWPMTASGKTDHASIHLALLRSCGMSSDTPPVTAAHQPCLRLLS